MTLLLSLGAVCFFWGIAALSLNTKELPFVLKMSPLLLTSVSALFIWFHFAATYPVISKAKVDVVTVIQPGELIANVEVKKVRQCKFMDMNVMVVDDKGVPSRASFTLLENPNPGTLRPMGYSSLGETLIIKQTPGHYSKMYFVTHHECAFENIVESHFGDTDLPPEFSQFK